MYAAEIEGQRLTFEAEAVWRRNMIMRDRETGTLWQHATGEGLKGLYEGYTLEMLPNRQLSLGDWLEEHPHSTVSKGPEEWPGLVPLPWTLTILERATSSGKVPGLTNTDTRLEQNQEVVGITIDSVAKAYPREVVKSSDLILDEVADIKLALVYWQERGEIFIYRLPSDPGELVVDQASRQVIMNERRWTIQGEPVNSSDRSLQLIEYRRTWWSGWYEFHPDTGVFESKR